MSNQERRDSNREKREVSSVLGVAEYQSLLAKVLTDEQAQELIRQQVFSFVLLSPLSKALTSFAVKEKSASGSDEKLNVKVLLRRAKLPERFASLSAAQESLLPKLELAVGNLENFLEAFLLIDDLDLRRKIFTLFSNEWSSGFNFYHYLEVAGLLKRMQRSASSEEKTTYPDDNGFCVKDLSPEHFGDLISLVAGLMVMYLPNRFHRQTKKNNLAVLNVLNSQLVPPALGSLSSNKSTNGPSNQFIAVKDQKGGERVVRNTGIGFFANALLGAKEIGDHSLSGKLPVDSYSLALPGKLDWLINWRGRALYRYGLPICFEALAAEADKTPNWDQDTATTIVLPTGGLPLILFLNRNFLLGRSSSKFSRPGKTVTDYMPPHTPELLGAYQAHPCLEDQAYPSGTKLIDALLIMDQERYRLNLTSETLALANLGAISLLRNGRSFRFESRHPKEKKLYELGLRSLQLKKDKFPQASEKQNPCLAQVSISLVGGIEVSFSLLADGTIADFAQTSGWELSPVAGDFLRQVAIFYLGCLEIPASFDLGTLLPGVGQPQTKKTERVESITEQESNFRVMSGQMPDHHGLWDQQDWPINVLLEHRLGAALPTINRLFVELQTLMPFTQELSEDDLYLSALTLVKSELVDLVVTPANLAILLKVLWLRARAQWSKSRETNVPAQRSLRLRKAIRQGLLGTRAKEEALLDQIFTVTFVQESKGDCQMPNAAPILYHLPLVAEFLFSN